MLNRKDRELVTYNAEIRSIDPCGYIDTASVSKVGVLKEFTAMKSQTDCELNVVVDRDYERSLEINVGIIPKGNAYESDSHQVTVAGRSIIENTEKWPGRPTNPGANTCYNLIPFSDYSVLKVAVQRRTNDAACNETHTIVEGIIPRLRDWPQRKDSTKHAYHAISVRDPCDLLVTLGAGHRIMLGAGDRIRLGLVPSPWKCEFNLDNNDIANYYRVQLEWRPVVSFSNPANGYERVEIASLPALRDQTTGTCQIEVGVPDPHDGSKYDPIYDQATVLNTVSVNAQTCDKAEAAAATAVNAFLG